MRALGCGVGELVARLGQQNAIKRVKTELRRAKRARSRKLHRSGAPFSSSRIETETDEQRKTKPARSAQHMTTPGNDAWAQDSLCARDVRVGADAFRTPAPWRQPTNMPRREPSPRPMTSFSARPRLQRLSRDRCGLGIDGAMGRNAAKQPARARHDGCEHMRRYATPRLGQGSRVRHRRLTPEAARTVTSTENLPDQR